MNNNMIRDMINRRMILSVVCCTFVILNGAFAQKGSDEQKKKVAKKYATEHKELLEKGNEVTAYNDYMINKLKAVTDRINYKITFKLTKKDDIWIVNSLSQSDREKIHGLNKE